MKLGVCGSALSWFKSYLEGRSQRICIKETLSQSFDLQWGVPQGSCLGPLLFTIYSSDLFSHLESHLPTAQAYADDSLLYLSFSPSVGTGELDAVTAIENCIRDIRQWMCVRKLMLNDDKTEFLLVGTRKQLKKCLLMALESEIIILVLLHQSVIWAHGLTRIWIWMYILPKHAAEHFIIFIISDILGSTYPEVAVKH